MFGKEPAVILSGLGELFKAIIPLLILFELVNWSDKQIAGLMFFSGVAISVFTTWFTRQSVVPVETASAQILTATRMPEGTSVKAVIAKTEKESNA